MLLYRPGGLPSTSKYMRNQQFNTLSKETNYADSIGAVGQSVYKVGKITNPTNRDLKFALSFVGFSFLFLFFFFHMRLSPLVPLSSS